MQDFLFAYGTILQGASDDRVAAAINRYTERLDDGRVAGRLYDLGPYPGAVPLAQGDPRQEWIRGQILYVLDPTRVFHVLDPYEDCNPERPREGLYRRERVLALPESNPESPVDCQIYWINKVPVHAQRIESGDWYRYAEDSPSQSRPASR